jgi:hypothetical protein
VRAVTTSAGQGTKCLGRVETGTTIQGRHREAQPRSVRTVAIATVSTLTRPEPVLTTAVSPFNDGPMPGVRKDREVAVPMNFHRLLWLAHAREARAAAKKTRVEDLQVWLLLEAARYALLAQQAAVTPGSDEEKGTTPG